MNKIILLAFVIALFAQVPVAFSHEGEYIRSTCRVLASNINKIRLNHASTEKVLDVYDKFTEIVFKCYIKDLIKNLKHEDETCGMGFEAGDYTQAANFFFEGIHEVKSVHSQMSPNHYLIMQTKRSAPYKPNSDFFTIAH